MAFKVTFYQFNKKYNSTKRPEDTDSHKEFDCRVLNGTAIYNPKIELDLGLTATPAKWNYCVIPAFDNRYYFIREWSFDRGLWIASLEEDVLASWRNTIGNTNLYILRAANEYDGLISDTLYPAKVKPTVTNTSITTVYTSPSAGCFVIGVVSKHGNFGSLTYHAMSAAELAGLCTALQDPTLVQTDPDFSLNDMSAALELNLIDPMQYIKSCVWLPFNTSDISGTDIPASGPTGGFDIYNWHLTGFTHRIVSNTAPYISKSKTVSQPWHPDVSSRGDYVNYAPYTFRTLSFPPFGCFEVDTSIASQSKSLSLTLLVDVLTGRGILDVKNSSSMINRIEAQIGVPVQLAQVTRDWIGGVNQVLGGVKDLANGIASAAMGNAAGAVGGVIGAAQGVMNGYAAIQPRANTIGSGGGYSHLKGTFQLTTQFFRPVADDPTHNGRPLCAMRKPKNLGGYMLVQDGDITGATTQIEGEKIKAFLETGFYYE